MNKLSVYFEDMVQQRDADYFINKFLNERADCYHCNGKVCNMDYEQINKCPALHYYTLEYLYGYRQP